MKVSRDTWHARNWRYWLDTSLSKRADKYREHPRIHHYGRPPQQANLCIYFWVAVARTPFLKFVRNGKTQGSGLFLLAYLAAFIVGNAAGVLVGRETALFFFLIYPLGGAALLATLIGTSIFGAYLLELHRRRKHSTTQQEPNILIEHIRAKKNRICPLLEFEEQST